MPLEKETPTAYLVMAACLAAACGIRYVGHSIDFDLASGPITFALRILLLFVWVGLLRRRLVRREVVQLLCAFASTLFVWWCLQFLRYDFSGSMPNVGRWLWYLYYVPTMFAPPLLLLAVSYVGMPRSWRPSRLWALPFVVSGALAAIVLTNDVHQLVFDYGTGVVVDGLHSPDYAKGPFFYVVWGWAGVLVVLALATLARRCARSRLLGRALVPTAIFCLTSVLLLSYAPNQPSLIWKLFTTTDLACLGIVAYVESLLATGIFPSNSGYGALWSASSLGGGFLDGEGRPFALSANAPTVSEAQVARALERPVPLDSGCLELVARRVTGGTVFWVRDQGAVRRLSQELEDLGDALAQERSMLESELEVARGREALAQRQELYAGVVSRTAAQLATLQAMLDAMPEDNGAFLERMRLASVYAAYIKRCANLTFVGEGGCVDARELSLAFEESCARLRLMGADVSVALPDAGSLSSSDALDAYVEFERLVEETLPNPTSMWVGGTSSRGQLELSVVACGTAGRRELSLAVPLVGDAS